MSASYQRGRLHDGPSPHHGNPETPVLSFLSIPFSLFRALVLLFLFLSPFIPSLWYDVLIFLSFFLSFLTLILLLFTQQSANFFYDFFILISCMKAICFLNSNWSFPVFQSIAYLINDIYSAKTYCLISKVMIKYMYNLFNHFVNQITNCEYLNLPQNIFIHTQCT